MGLLDWLGKRRATGPALAQRSGADQQPPAQQAPATAAPHARPDPMRTPIRLDADGRVSVVGESHYQPALEAAAAGRFSTGYEDAIPTTAALIPEPRNLHDRNAVRVDVDGRTVGYLARELAVHYQPPLLDLQRRGHNGVCPAQITGGGRGRSYGIFLHLGSPNRLVPLNSSDGLHLLASERRVTVTREEHHQQVIANVLGSATGGGTVFASVHECTIERGKHAGSTALEVRIDGRRVGELTKAMSDRYAPAVHAVTASGALPGCQASIESTGKGWQVELRLPA